MRLDQRMARRNDETASDAPAGKQSSVQAPPFGLSARTLFQLEESAVYLNHGAFGALSVPVSDAATALRRRIERHPSRFLRQELNGLLRDTAARLGAYVGARGEDIVFLDNATTAINAVLRSFMLMPGDEVVTTSHTYSAVMRTLEFVCDRADTRLIQADVPFPLASAEEALDAIFCAVSPRTRLMVIDHVTSKTALVMPVAEIVAEAHDRGIAVLIDGAHAPGMLPLSVEALGADFYAANAHKWLGAPRGSAFLWAAEFRQPFLRPTTISHFVADGYLPAFDWPGTKDFTPYLTIPDALSFRARWGEEAIRDYCRTLVCDGAALLARDLGTVRGGPDGLTGFMATVALPDAAGPAKASTAERLRNRLLEEYDIEVDIQPIDDRLWMRLSAYIYNRIEDYEALSAALKRLL